MRELYRSRLRTTRLTARYSSTLQALPAFAQLGVLLLGGFLALHGRVSLGVFLAFSSYLIQLLAPIRLLSGMLASSQQARAGAERVLELLDLEPRIGDHARSRPLSHCTGRVELERVAFGYVEGEPILEDVTLSVAPGERLGIVGSSGSGKTTLALLIARFYDPRSGQVRIDDHDVRDYALDSLRRQLGIVFEDSFLFSSTIGENIALGRPEASASEIEAAARAAQAHGFIAALPRGYATRVGERGSTLSGGQRQRIALARTILANPKILILDDATSAIDADTEEAIHRSLESVMHDRTTVIIATGNPRCAWQRGWWCWPKAAWSPKARTKNCSNRPSCIDSCSRPRPRRTGRGRTAADEGERAGSGRLALDLRLVGYRARRQR